jgi:lactate permease
VVVQAALTGLHAVDIAWRTASLHALLGAVLMWFFVRTLAAAGHRPGLAWAALACAGFLLPSLALAALIGPELATLGGALVGGVLFVATLRRRGGGGRVPGMARAMAPYGALVVLVVVTRSWPPLAQALGGATIEWRLFGQFHGRMEPLTHPGTLLMTALVVGALVQRMPVRAVGSALVHSARLLAPVTVALLAMLVLSRLMLHAGLIAALERAAVQGVGAAWPWVAPAVGALGSFVTGSATASNVLFTTLQAQTATALGLPAVVIVAAQGVGAAVGNIVCPHNIVAGAATVGLAGRESDVLRYTVVPCVVYLVLAGAAVAALARWSTG